VRNNFDYLHPRIRLWTDSPFMLDICQRVYPEKQIPIVPNIVDGKTFAFRPQSERDPGLLLAFPRKGREFIEATRAAYGALGGTYWRFDLVHGVSLKPGKPTILGVCDDKAVFGLPGNPVSCMVTYDLFVSPTLAYLSGMLTPPRRTLTARLTRNIASATGREDYVQVRLSRDADGTLEAVPVFGKSNLIFSLVRADGMLKVPLDAGGLNAGATVEVVLF